MSYTIEILGSNATAPSASGPASGYLVRTPTGNILVDAGPGVMAEYCARHELDQLRAIVVTHLHADHCLDLMALAYRWTFPTLLPRIPLYIPRGELPRLRAFDEVFGIPSLPSMARPIETAWEVIELGMSGELEDGFPERTATQVTLRSFRAHHAVPAAALRFELANEGTDSRVVAFSGDTGYSPEVVEAARAADIFVCEATYLEADDQALTHHGHLTATLAGDLACEAAVKHLVLAHFSTDDMRGPAVERASEAFTGRVTAAERGAVYR